MFCFGLRAPPRPLTKICRGFADPFQLSSAALCQVFDSIYMDLPMSRVKFNANTEYQYVQNFKILQSTWWGPVYIRLFPLLFLPSLTILFFPQPRTAVSLCVPSHLSSRDPALTRTRLLQEAEDRQAHPRRTTHQVQDAGQPRVPAVDEALLGHELPRP